MSVLLSLIVGAVVKLLWPNKLMSKNVLKNMKLEETNPGCAEEKKNDNELHLSYKHGDRSSNRTHDS